MAYVTLDQTKKVAQAVKNYTDGRLEEVVEKVEGKGLSTEDFTTEEKTKLEALENYDDTLLVNKVGSLETAIGNKVDSVDGKGLSTNDFTNSDKQKLDSLENYDDTEVRESLNALQSSTAGQIASSITTINQAINNLEESKVDKVDGKVLSDNNYSDADKDKLDGLTNYDDTSVRELIDGIRTDLANYYTKNETYTKTQVDEIVSEINALEIIPVLDLPTANIKKAIYLVKDSEIEGNLYSEYIYIDDKWEKFGTGVIDLSAYVTNAALALILADYAKKTELPSLNGYATEAYVDDKVKTDVPANALFTDTIYDDTALAQRVSDAESAIETLEQTGYDDTAIKGRVTDLETALDGHTVGKDVPSDALFTDTVYNDTALANRVSAVETSLSGKADTSDIPDVSGFATTSAMNTALDAKANTSDLAAVATSGSYNDLSDKPEAYTLPTASDTTLGGIKVDSTSGATVEDGILKVAQQTAAGGGAIPAYIVGDTMTNGWLSLEENGTALTPVDKQEYVILSPGEWLRKHVMWFDDISVYRLTGKVMVTDELQREIARDSSKEVVRNVTVTKQIVNLDSNTTLNAATITGLLEGDKLEVNFRYVVRTGYGKTIYVGAPSAWTDTITSGGSWVSYENDNSANFATYSKTIIATAQMASEGFYIRLVSTPKSGNQKAAMVYDGTVKVTSNPPYKDYETDGVIDITEEEIEQIWNETAGEPAPENNVFSTEKRLWGYFIDGKPIYRKTISCGALPNNAIKEVAHGISGGFKIVKIEGVAISESATIPLPFPSPNTDNNSHLQLHVDSANVCFWTKSTSFGVYTETYVTLYFTETT